MSRPRSRKPKAPRLRLLTFPQPATISIERLAVVLREKAWKDEATLEASTARAIVAFCKSADDDGEAAEMVTWTLMAYGRCVAEDDRRGGGPLISQGG